MTRRRSAPRVRPAERFETLPPLNDRQPLSVVRLADGRLGTVDADTFGVWIEYDLKQTVVPDWSALPRVTLPPIPAHYGEWVTKAIGGVSSTVRRVGGLRVKKHVTHPVTLFAMRMPSQTLAHDTLVSLADRVTVGDTQTVLDDPEIGHVAEVVVHDAVDVDMVAARLARAGAGRVVLEDATLDALQPVGIERLDRVEAAICKSDDQDDRVHPTQFGMGRGAENWMFPWLPETWPFPPSTWDYMVRNVDDAEDLRCVPQPLRYHLARFRCTVLSEIAEPSATHRAQLRTARGVLFHSDGSARPRPVSAGLARAQSKQLITAFFALCIEKVDPHSEVGRTASLLLFQYMVRRGFTARYMGKYQQLAKYIGNGDTVRRFNRLAQYAPHRLPSDVLERLADSAGVVKGKGNKGSRSKYVSRDVRYVPKRRMPRGAS